MYGTGDACRDAKAEVRDWRCVGVGAMAPRGHVWKHRGARGRHREHDPGGCLRFGRGRWLTVT